MSYGVKCAILPRQFAVVNDCCNGDTPALAIPLAQRKVEVALMRWALEQVPTMMDGPSYRALRAQLEQEEG